MPGCVWKRIHSHSFLKKLTILTDYHLHKMLIFIQPQITPNLFQPENSLEAVKSRTILNIILHVLLYVNKPFVDWRPRGRWPPCVFVIRDGFLLRYRLRLVRVSTCPSFRHPLRVRSPAAVPRVQKGRWEAGSGGEMASGSWFSRSKNCLVWVRL